MAKFKNVIDPDDLIVDKEEKKSAATELLESLASSKTKDTRISVRVDEETLKSFRRICEVRSINGSNWLRGIIQNFVEENKEVLN